MIFHVFPFHQTTKIKQTNRNPYLILPAFCIPKNQNSLHTRLSVFWTPEEDFDTDHYFPQRSIYAVQLLIWIVVHMETQWWRKAVLPGHLNILKWQCTLWNDGRGYQQHSNTAALHFRHNPVPRWQFLLYACTINISSFLSDVPYWAWKEWEPQEMNGEWWRITLLNNCV